MRATTLLLLPLLAATDLAQASGFACTGSERRVELDLEASTDAGRGGAIYDALGRLKVKVGGKTRFATVDLDASHLSQYWSDDDELRVRFKRHVEGDPSHEAEEGGDLEEAGLPAGGNAELIITARRDASSGDFEGTWLLRTSLLNEEASGAIACQVDLD